MKVMFVEHMAEGTCIFQPSSLDASATQLATTVNQWICLLNPEFIIPALHCIVMVHFPMLLFYAFEHFLFAPFV
jgi:hypothetical protein